MDKIEKCAVIKFFVKEGLTPNEIHSEVHKCLRGHAPAHVSVLAMGKLRDMHYELLEHPPYSPDLAPSDFSFFPKLKLFLAGQRFSSNQEAIAAVERYFADLTKNHYRDGIMALEHHWNKCISIKGDYFKE
jgi:histone-lysine N-methyltransferase SETMAR